MSTTTYYEFNKPEGTDLVNPLVDTNPNWDALDADLHEFNERSIANCTEIVTLGVHAISRLDTTAKFLKWIATANFTDGETFTVDGLAVAASTPAGASLATGAYVTGSVVLACLNADNTAMTVFVSGTTVASDAQRLGGELPAFYAKQSDMTTAESNITNLQNKMGNTSIVGIGDGTATGAISAINADLIELERRGAMPTLNYTTPLHSFTNGNLSYTATKECYLVGDSKCGDPGYVKINNTQIAVSYAHHGTSGYTYDNSISIMLKLTAGDVVATSGDAPSLHVFDVLS